jgi:hypothetical protein
MQKYPWFYQNHVILSFDKRSKDNKKIIFTLLKCTMEAIRFGVPVSVEIAHVAYEFGIFSF